MCLYCTKFAPIFKIADNAPRLTHGDNYQNIFVVGQHKIKLKKNILADEIAIFEDYNAMNVYPKKLKKVKYFDEKNGKVYVCKILIGQ